MLKKIRHIFKSLRSKKSGFSLFEAALLSTMFASIITVGLTNYALKRDSNQIYTMEQKLTLIKDRIDGFADVQGFLPCPARYDLASTDEDYLKEARDTTYCYTGTGVETLDSDSATDYGSARFPADPTVDFIKGKVPCRTLGLQENCGEDKNGNQISYVMANVLSEETPCTHYLKDDLTTEERPYTLKILDSADPGDDLPTNYTNYGKYSDSDDEPFYALVWHGDDGVGAFNNNGGKNAAQETVSGTYIGDNYFQALNHHSYTGGNMQYLLSPSHPIDTPTASLSSEAQKITFGDIVMWSRPAGVDTKVCAHCRSCQTYHKNDSVSIDVFNSCIADVTPSCACAANSDCDEGAGECCNTGTGRCQSSPCSGLTVACVSSSGGCSGGNLPYSGPPTVSDCADVTADVSIGTVLFTGTTATNHPYSLIYDGSYQDGSTCVPRLKMKYEYICRSITTTPAIDGFTDNQYINVYTNAASSNLYGATFAAPTTAPTLTYASTSSGAVGVMNVTMRYKEDGVDKNRTFDSDVSNTDTYRGYTYVTESSGGTYDCPMEAVCSTSADCDSGFRCCSGVCSSNPTCSCDASDDCLVSSSECCRSGSCAAAGSYTVQCTSGCNDGTLAYSGSSPVACCEDITTSTAKDTVLFSGTLGNTTTYSLVYKGGATYGTDCRPKVEVNFGNMCKLITNASYSEPAGTATTTSVESDALTFGSGTWTFSIASTSSTAAPEVSAFLRFIDDSGAKIIDEGSPWSVTGSDSYRGYQIPGSTACTQDSPCTQNSDCGSEYCCSGVCQAAACSCAVESTCADSAPTSNCCGVGGTCVSEGNCACTLSSQCNAGSDRCCSGECDFDASLGMGGCACSGDDDCLSGEVCCSGFCAASCAPPACTSDTDCSGGQCCCPGSAPRSCSASCTVSGCTGSECSDTMSTCALTLLGLAGNDTFTATGAMTSILPGNDDDTITGSSSADTICESQTGGCVAIASNCVGSTSGSNCTGNDIFYGMAGNDIIVAGSGSDHIYGGDGDDTITTDGSGTETNTTTNYVCPGNNTDVTTAGGGNDYIYMEDSWGNDSIVSFNTSADRIYLNTSGFAPSISQPVTCDSVANSARILRNGSTICVRGVSTLGFGTNVILDTPCP